MTDPEEAFWVAVEAAVTYQGEGDRPIGSDDFDRAAGHAIALINDAANAYSQSSCGTSVFLALTALEETAKAELLCFRGGDRGPNGYKKRTRSDPLLSHKTKHVLAVRPTVFLGKRLPAAIGADRCKQLQLAVASGDLVKLREQALYVSFGPGGIATPSERITRMTAREVLLLAIEAADDVLVGWTNLSVTFSAPLDALFRKIEALGK